MFIPITHKDRAYDGSTPSRSTMRQRPRSNEVALAIPKVLYDTQPDTIEYGKPCHDPILLCERGIGHRFPSLGVGTFVVNSRSMLVSARAVLPDRYSGCCRTYQKVLGLILCERQCRLELTPFSLSKRK